MGNITIIVNSAPYGDEKVWNALRLSAALRSSSIGMTVKIFLLGDAVAAAKKGQKTPDFYYNIEKMLRDLHNLGVPISVCETCLNARALTNENLIEGIEVGTMITLAGWIKDSVNVLTF